MSQRSTLDTELVPIWKYRSSLPKLDLSSPVENRERIINEGGGILLWGPPGCGKSSGKSHIHNLLDVELVIFDSDDFNEYTIKILFPEMYKALCKEKHEIVQLKARDYLLFETRIADFLVKENNFKMKIGRARFSELPGFIEYYGCNPTKPKILEDVFSLIEDYLLDKFYIPLDREIYDKFIKYWIRDSGQTHPDELSVRDILFRFGVYFCKIFKKTFVMETTGKTYDSLFLEWCFRGIPNILYMPFIYDFGTLMKRVNNRLEQFGNAPQQYVEEAFQNAYGKNLLEILHMNLFDQIIVQGNNLVNYVMMSLEKLDGIGYILVKEFANDVHEAEYIRLILGSLFVPDHLHHHSDIVYDMRKGEWEAVLRNPRISTIAQ